MKKKNLSLLFTAIFVLLSVFALQSFTFDDGTGGDVKCKKDSDKNSYCSTGGHSFKYGCKNHTKDNNCDDDNEDNPGE